MKSYYDMIIVGGRVAGAATAIYFARSGKRVLVIERTKTLGDTLSTHFIYPRGCSYLKDLDVLDQLTAVTPHGTEMQIDIEDFSIKGSVSIENLKDRLQKVHGKDFDSASQICMSVRRKILDPILLQQARKMGAEVRMGTSFEGLVRDSKGKITGIKAREEGVTRIFFSNLIIGADGKNSVVARTIEAKKIEEKANCTYACYTYISGFDIPRPLIQKKGRLALAAVATNDNKNMILVFGPKHLTGPFFQNKNKAFMDQIRYLNPELAQKIETSGKREENLFFTKEMSAFMRKNESSRVVLLGDASCFKDQCTASGITHALRDSRLLFDCLSSQRDQTQALGLFRRRRFLDSHRYYDFVANQAQMKPLREDERELFSGIEQSQNDRNNFIGVYGDTVCPRKFFGQRNLKRIRAASKVKPKVVPPGKLDALKTLDGTDFLSLRGSNLMGRTKSYYAFYQHRLKANAYQYHRVLSNQPGTQTSIKDSMNRKISGLNLASQDYLSLGQHPKIIEAAKRAIRDYGVHSAGSPMVIGNTSLTVQLENEIKSLTGKKHVIIFPTGFAAGSGTIQGLVRPYDHIVMDRLAHTCLQHGANASTKNIHRFPHLNVEFARAHLEDIRTKDTKAGILLITEGIYSMDADSPNIRAFQELANEFGATLMVDVAHDLGATGPDGTGMIGTQGMYGKVDLIMGSFSKTFASNGGFLATDSDAVRQYVMMYGSPHIFSNALSPPQTAVALEATKIVQSSEGEHLRSQVQKLSILMRNELSNHGAKVFGNPCPIVPVLIGSEPDARRCHQEMTEAQIATMILEYPVVAIGESRFRVQLMASHTKEQVLIGARAIAETITVSNDSSRQHLVRDSRPVLATLAN